MARSVPAYLTPFVRCAVSLSLSSRMRCSPTFTMESDALSNWNGKRAVNRHFQQVRQVYAQCPAVTDDGDSLLRVIRHDVGHHGYCATDKAVRGLRLRAAASTLGWPGDAATHSGNCCSTSVPVNPVSWPTLFSLSRSSVCTGKLERLADLFGGLPCAQQWAAINRRKGVSIGR